MEVAMMNNHPFDRQFMVMARFISYVNLGVFMPELFRQKNQS